MAITSDALSAIDRVEEVSAKPTDEDLRCWSVTTLQNTLSSYALDKYKAEQPVRVGAEEYLEKGVKAPWISRLENEGVDSAVEYLTAFRWDDKALAATELGTAVHSACEAFVLSGVRPTRDELTAMASAAQEKRKPNQVLSLDVLAEEVEVIELMVIQFERFLDVFSPTFLAAEVTVYSPSYGYAGRCDGFMAVDAVRFIYDIKTTRDDVSKGGKPKTPYADVGLQLAAYRYAEMAAVWKPRVHTYYSRRYYLLSPTEQELAVPVPEVDGGAVVYITPERCELYPVRCDEAVHESFLYVVEAARWQNELSKGVVGEPMVAPRKGE